MSKSEVFYLDIWPGGFWFRLFGYGLHCKDVRKHRLMFSERNGYVKLYQIGPYSFKVLKPDNRSI